MADFHPGQNDTQVIVTWELPIEHAHLGPALRIAFDIDLSPAVLRYGQVCWNGARAAMARILASGAKQSDRQSSLGQA